MSTENKFQMDFVVHSTGGKVHSSVNKSFRTHSTDNRSDHIAESLFIPLVGENHDAHKYVRAAVEAGATGVLFHNWDDDWEDLKTEASFIEVDNTLKALQDLASAWRQKFSGQVLALTGSNGKTTTKDFLLQILNEFAEVSASQGSFNNHWGLPLTLLDANLEQEYCITEMGMNHGGEITELNQLAQPDLVAVTNVGRAHMGNFANGIEGVAEAKKEIYLSAPHKAKLLFNIDNEWTRKMYNEFSERPCYTFSTKNFSADVYLKIKKPTATGYLLEGQIGGVIDQCEVSFWGQHNVENLSAAVCMAYIAGIAPQKIWPVLKKCSTGWGRNQCVDLSLGKLLFDGYNANPDSFLQLLNNLKQSWSDSNKYIAVFGEMLELGEKTSEEHYELGKKAGALNWQQVVFIGTSGADFLRGFKATKNKIKPIILNTYEESLDLDLPSMVNDQSLVIVKGSRGLKLERVVQRLAPINFSPKK